MFLVVNMSRDICSVEVYMVRCDGYFEPYKISKEMRGVVSPLRVTLILTVLHLHLKRAGIQSLSSRTGKLAHIFQQVPLC